MLSSLEADTRKSPLSSKSREVMWLSALRLEGVPFLVSDEGVDGKCLAGRYVLTMSPTFCWEGMDMLVGEERNGEENEVWPGVDYSSSPNSR